MKKKFARRTSKAPAWGFTLAAMVSLSFLTAAVARELSPTLKLEALTTKQGVLYEQVQVLRVEAAGATMMHSRGTSLIPIPEIPPDVSSRLVGISTTEGESQKQHDARVWKQLTLHRQVSHWATLRAFVLLQKLPDKGYLAEELLGQEGQDLHWETRRLVYLRPESDFGVVITDSRSHEIELRVAEAGFQVLATGQQIPAFWVY